MKYTILLSASIVLAYYFLQEALFVPYPLILRYGLRISNPLSYLTYAFVHVGVHHLISNVLALLPLAYFLEKRVAHDVLGVFFVSSVLGGLIFAILSPKTILVGCSAGVFGVFGALFLVDPRKFLVALVLSTLLIALSPHVSNYIERRFAEELVREKMEKMRTLQEKTAQISAVKEQVSKISSDINKLTQEMERAPPEKKERIRTEIERKKGLLEVQRRKIEELEKYKEMVEEELQRIRRMESIYSSGKSLEARAAISFLSHAVGIFFGMVYMYVRRRDMVEKSLEQMMLWFRLGERSA